MYIICTAEAGRRSWQKSLSRKDNEAYLMGEEVPPAKNKIITVFEK